MNEISQGEKFLPLLKVEFFFSVFRLVSSDQLAWLHILTMHQLGLAPQKVRRSLFRPSRHRLIIQQDVVASKNSATFKYLPNSCNWFYPILWKQTNTILNFLGFQIISNCSSHLWIFIKNAAHKILWLAILMVFLPLSAVSS